MIFYSNVTFYKLSTRLVRRSALITQVPTVCRVTEFTGTISSKLSQIGGSIIDVMLRYCLTIPYEHYI